MPRRLLSLFLPCLAISLSAATASRAEVIEQVEYYSIRGSTALELYQSIGERGPELSSSRVIAQTGFKLTWKRDYQQRGTDCVLASAVPRLIITTRLPKPASALSGDLAARWKTFIDGVTVHEKVHGENARVLAKEIEKSTVGLSAENDPDCNKLRAKMQPILKEISQARQAKDRDFDKAEFTNGGAVHTLILNFVNER